MKLEKKTKRNSIRIFILFFLPWWLVRNDKATIAKKEGRVVYYL
jgi:hypothetical protein